MAKQQEQQETVESGADSAAPEMYVVLSGGLSGQNGISYERGDVITKHAVPGVERCLKLNAVRLATPDEAQGATVDLRDYDDPAEVAAQMQANARVMAAELITLRRENEELRRENAKLLDRANARN